MNAQLILPGDKVATWKDGVFFHPIIHIGSGWFVEKAKNGVVRSRHGTSFPKGQNFPVVQRPAPHEAPRVVQRAVARLGPEQYDPLTSNCQHFANEVMTGESKSEQVDALKGLAVVGLALLVVIAIAS